MNTKLATSRMRTGQWADIIKDCKESGLKVDDYCARHGLSRNAYFYWLRKVKEAALTHSGFVEVRQQGIFCKHFLKKVAKYRCRLLYLYF
ncbi:IS66 family insertion sequence element accessory protein TnpA [Oribacterium parvum]|uniref:IS66 family insertion sequence element accessory protein TnpA n=1 Tax=Oribacterium parvum TaxID=1501329 RepID=UPI0028E7BE13|nr:transposase [Oribacterium parvum]